MNNPKITVMGRVGLLDLATVCSYLDKKGRPPKTQSALIRDSINILADNLSDDAVTDISQAKTILKSVGIKFDRDIEDKKKDQKPTIKIDLL